MNVFKYTAPLIGSGLAYQYFNNEEERKHKLLLEDKKLIAQIEHQKHLQIMADKQHQHDEKLVSIKKSWFTKLF